MFRSARGAWSVTQLAAVLVSVAVGHDAVAGTSYHIKVRSATGVTQRFAFALTCADSAANTLTLYNATHDGQGAVSSTEGGPVGGALLVGSNPADTTLIIGGAGYSELLLQLTSASAFDCDLALTEQAPPSGHAASEAAIYYLPGAVAALYPTADPLGTNTLIALGVTGGAGGDLGVFSPMTFIAPDTLVLDAELLDAPIVPKQAGRLQFTSQFPNPAHIRVRFDFRVPDPGGIVRLRVFDVTGRLVGEPWGGSTSSGPHTVTWRISRLPPGVYLAMLQMSGQSLVRRLIVAR